MIRAILVDDIEDQLNDLKEKLQPYSKDVEVIGAFTDPWEAIPEIMHRQPDVLFLDIEMPGLSGFKVADSVKEICNKVIFLTSHLTDSSDTDPYIIAKNNDMQVSLTKAIAKLIAKFNTEKLPTPTTPEIRKLIVKEEPQIELLLFDGKSERHFTIKLKSKNYKTLRIFVEVQKGISKDISTGYINQKEHRDTFINLPKYKTDFIEAVNKELAEYSIKFSIDDFFSNANRGQHTLAIASEKVHLALSLKNN